MNLPPGYRITTRRLLTAVSDVVYQLKDDAGHIVAERLSPLSEQEALDLIKMRGTMVAVNERSAKERFNHALKEQPVRGTRYEGDTE